MVKQHNDAHLYFFLDRDFLSEFGRKFKMLFLNLTSLIFSLFLRFKDYYISPIRLLLSQELLISDAFHAASFFITLIYYTWLNFYAILPYLSIIYKIYIFLTANSTLLPFILIYCFSCIGTYSRETLNYN